MTGEQLRSLRAGAGLNQTEAAAALGTTLGALQRYERGQASVPDEVANMAAAAFFGVHADEDGDEIVSVALGEAALMLSDAQREQLYGRVHRTLVAEAVARVVKARVQDTLASALTRTEGKLADAERALRDVGARVRGA